MTQYTIIIPTFNEEAEIEACLGQLQDLRAQGAEVIVVDGGSSDKTTRLVAGHCDQLILSRRGRAVQMNAGARQAGGEILFFLHVDSRLPEKFSQMIFAIESNILFWGRFDVQLTGKHWSFRLIESMMNLRSRLTGIATGDQVIFMSKTLYHDVNGFPEIELMEDIAMSRKLKKIRSPLCMKQKVLTSSRRWEKNGIINTILKMWWLRFSYFIGVEPVRLARQYD